MDIMPVTLIVIPIITACLIHLIHKPWISILAFVCQGLLTILLLQYSAFIQVVGIHDLIIGPWDSWIGIGLRNDLLSLCFLWLTLLFWWITLFYIWSSHKENYKFLFFLLFLEATFLGLLQCNDLFSLFVFIEITTILSTILIIYEKNGYAIKSGIYYLLFNSVGMLFYQLGFIFLYTTMGTLNMTLLTERLAVVPHSSILRLANLFFLVAICVKSAIFPVYNWLPRAHSAAPSAISALLSGLLVKSGIYAFIRIQALFGLTFMNSFFFSLGLLSAVSGMIFALSQKDLKQILAYSTVSQIGLIVMGLSQPNTMMYLGGITHLVNHSLIKSLLFLCAGVIIHHTGKRKITEIRGIFKTMPLLSIAMIVGMVSITGGFLTNGYLSKSLLVYGLQKQGITARLVYEVINLGTITYFMKIAQIFFGPPCTKPQKIVLGQRVAISLLASICLIIPWFYSSIWGFFGLDLPTLTLFSWSKFFLLSFQVAIGFVCLKWMMNQEPKFMSTIRHFQLSFGASNGLMLFFLILMIAAADLL